ncbi:winged helix-turn-helix transcriptional regulator [Candidatus Woesearchaeota archaeon]|nr:winged helix-turn-helix transcriptional regulator [Candidatus Woesearchaeota archaeon]
MLFLFDSGETTFTMLKKHLKVTSRALSKKLKLLETLGLVERIAVDNPRKIFYTLSERGKDISQGIIAFSRKFSE